MSRFQFSVAALVRAGGFFHRQQAADAPGIMERAAEIQAPGVFAGDRVVVQAVEDHDHVPVVVHEELVSSQSPVVRGPEERLLADPPAHVIIRENDFLVVRAGRTCVVDGLQPVFTIPSLQERAVVGQVAVNVVTKALERSCHSGAAAVASYWSTAQ